MKAMLCRFSLLVVAAWWVAAVPLSAQQQGYLKTKVNPGRTGVFVDGKYVGPAGNFAVSRKYALAPGEHEIKLVEPRYEDATEKVNIQAGKTAVINVTMKALPLAKPPFGLLRVKGAADKFTPVYVNNKFCGHAGEFNNSVQGLQLNPGKYMVKVGSGAEQEVTIEANKVSIVQAGK